MSRGECAEHGHSVVQDDKHKLVVMLRTRNTEVEALKETIGRQAAQLKVRAHRLRLAAGTQLRITLTLPLQDLSTWSEYYKSQLEQAETVITVRGWRVHISCNTSSPCTESALLAHCAGPSEAEVPADQQAGGMHIQKLLMLSERRGQGIIAAAGPVLA